MLNPMMARLAKKKKKWLQKTTLPLSCLFNVAVRNASSLIELPLIRWQGQLTLISQCVCDTTLLQQCRFTHWHVKTEMSPQLSNTFTISAQRSSVIYWYETLVAFNWELSRKKMSKESMVLWNRGKVINAGFLLKCHLFKSKVLRFQKIMQKHDHDPPVMMSCFSSVWLKSTCIQTVYLNAK